MFNLYAGGGQDPNSEFFNNLLDSNIGQDEAETTTDQPDEQEYIPSNDFIDGLHQYAKDTDNTDLQNQIDELRQQLSLRDHEKNLDEIQSDLEEKLMLAQFYQTPQGEDELMAKYEPKDTNSADIPDGSKYTAVNNPGNLRNPQTGQFQNYSTPEQGEHALLNQLNLYQTGRTKVTVPGTKERINGTTSLRDVMRAYAPKGDGKNNPTVYANFIAKQLGVSADTRIGDLSTQDWANAIKAMEGNPSSKKKQMGGYGVTFQGGRLGAAQKIKRPKYTIG